MFRFLFRAFHIVNQNCRLGQMKMVSRDSVLRISWTLWVCAQEIYSFDSETHSQSSVRYRRDLQFISPLQPCKGRQNMMHSRFHTIPCLASTPKRRRLHLKPICSSSSNRNGDMTTDDIDLQWNLLSGPPLRIVSVTDDYQPSSSATESSRDIKISAASGWGDGQHATTSLCLSFLAENAGSNKVLLFYALRSRADK
jgi:hypothetical protein